MDNEQLTSNLGELIKNQIEICEKLDKIGKQIKKIRKPKKESNYNLNNIFGNPVEQLDKIMFKQAGTKKNWEEIDQIKVEFKKIKEREQLLKEYPDYVCIFDQSKETKKGTILRFYSKCLDDVKYYWQSSCGFKNTFDLEYLKDNPMYFQELEKTDYLQISEWKVTFKVQEPKQDQKYYLCIKDLFKIKEGSILKFKEFDQLGVNLYTYKEPCGFIETIGFYDILAYKNNFIPIQQFDTLKEGQEIEFTLRNGKTYKGYVNSHNNKYWISLYFIPNVAPFYDTEQILFLNELCAKYNFRSTRCNYDWPEAPTLEDLTKDLNTLITLPDLSVKQLDQTESTQSAINEIKSFNDPIFSQANDLVDKFMPLVNGWNEDKPKYNECYQGAINEPIIGVWYYSKQNQRKAAIKCAIVHCELWWEKTFGCAAQEPLNIKEELQKMLSE